MDKETLVKMRDIRDGLLKEVKLEKSPEYRQGYIDGVIDIYNLAIKEPAETKP